MKEKYQEEIEEKLRHWDEQIEALKLKSKLAKGYQKATCDFDIQNLYEKREKLLKHLEELQLASDEKWPSLKPGLVAAVKSLQEEFSKVISKMK